MNKKIITIFVTIFMIIGTLVLTINKCTSPKEINPGMSEEQIKVTEKRLKNSNDSIDSLLTKEKVKVQTLSDSINLLEKQSKINKKQYEKDIMDIDSNTLEQDILFFTKHVPSSKVK